MEFDLLPWKNWYQYLNLFESKLNALILFLFSLAMVLPSFNCIASTNLICGSSNCLCYCYYCCYYPLFLQYQQLLLYNQSMVLVSFHFASLNVIYQVPSPLPIPRYYPVVSLPTSTSPFSRRVPSVRFAHYWYLLLQYHPS